MMRPEQIASLAFGIVGVVGMSAAVIHHLLTERKP